ncbi:TetR/AcrR family transcriptional regulator [Siminovitchia acidinfaciens]|uniref:TetR/AcrR family transcriptional regulator n=1 Tax=Siminovitchia acidinfaciens TaxID=2321395 RepID=A0A429Y6Q3_9BACI|nr:TetR/AcrR family transcriptional regulator [Siminovitchia acidinfaciens]RST77004.1 TetR/AcrR family transcriptional regulator [Siminovitchia acidinfaciens]
MVSKQESRSEQTKKEILLAAEKLFSKKGFDTVTIREIAKEAGCSHTTIYLYFKDKMALLHQLSMPPLQELKKQIEDVLFRDALSAEDNIRKISRKFIQFCLQNRNMYTLLFVTEATRVDEEEPDLEINKLRIELFGFLKKALQECLRIHDDDLLLAYTRIYFFTLHGIIGTYTQSKEPLDELMKRLESTFDDAVEVLLLGFKQKLKRGVK